MNRTVRTPAATLRPLADKLRDVRQSDIDRIDRMFRTLGPRLAAARRIERELDRILANRFNPLDYVRTDELGLSRIVADLLDPNAAHGQGSLFLRSFLEKIGNQVPDGRVPALDPASVATRCERSIDSYGRLDISIEIGTAGQQPLCIAIENKPFAADGEGQVDAYLKFLRSRYPGRFLLIYLSPQGGLPSPESLPPGACMDGLATLSYCPRSQAAAERHSTVQLHFALTDWLRECSLSCDVDRLRWFLRDMKNFCHRTFGGPLTTAREHQEVRDFILENDDNLLAAFAVLDAYPETRNEVIAGFLQRLCERVTSELEQEGLEAESYFADNWRADGMWVYRSSWKGESSTPYIWLGHDGTNACKWWLGIGFYPHGKGDHRIESLRAPLANCLGPPSQNAENYPWFRYLDQHGDWAPLLVRLHAERERPGELVEHFASEFAAFARKAAKLIDCVSSSDKART